MKILVVGSGGREHAIIRKLAQSKQNLTLFCAPGNAGISYDATCVPIAADDTEKMVQWAKSIGLDYCVVAPDDPLVNGMVDAFEEVDIPCFGPNKAAAIIEGSKIFSKDLMKKYNIPTAGYAVFDDVEKALEYIENYEEFPLVVKANGLALGKGVLICNTKNEAILAVKEMMTQSKFGAAGASIVVEEFLTGPEVSVLSFTDGETVVPMVSSMDHKRALDGDKGLNTGGMGTIAPNPFYTEKVAKECMDTIFMPTIKAMKKEGRTFKGCLYFGLMLTQNGPKVIEYNCRFGDPETQVVLPLLKTDLLEVMQATTNGTLSQINVEFYNKSAACVVLASGGYPLEYPKGKEIKGLENGQISDGDSEIFHAGTAFAQNNGEHAAFEQGNSTSAAKKLVTNGGRVLGACATADNLQSAVEKAYIAARQISFDGVHMRDDIGKKALNCDI